MARHKREEITDWVTSKEAAAILTTNSGHAIKPDYVRLLGHKGKLTIREIDARTKLYSRKEIEAYQVKPRGDGSVRRAVRKDAREKADSSDT